MQQNIVIVISKRLKRYLKAKRTRAPAYSRALRRIKEGGQEKLRSDFQNTRKSATKQLNTPASHRRRRRADHKESAVVPAAQRSYSTSRSARARQNPLPVRLTS